MLALSGVGYILSSSLKLSELLSILDSGGIRAYEFDALICSSDSELFYPGLSSAEDNGNLSELQLYVDADYEAHIAYRWDRESLRRTISRWSVANNQQLAQALVEDEKSPLSCLQRQGCKHGHFPWYGMTFCFF